MLRSRAWLAGDDEVAVLHRVALASAGVPVGPGADRPVIGIANSASELNPCNLPLRDLVGPVREGIEAAGGAGVEFPVISLGEDLMKPSAMLYRNLLAIEIEEMVRANPLDGLVILANCDKSVPGALMGAISANIPDGAGDRRRQERGHLPRREDRHRDGAVAAVGRAPGRPARRRGLARARAVPVLRPRRLQHDGHRVDDGGAQRGARADGARVELGPGRRPAVGGRRPGRPAS